MMSVYQKPDNEELRKFGIVFALFFILVFGLVMPMIRHDWSALFADTALWPRWPWLVSSMLLAIAIAVPAPLYYLHRPWMIFADVAGWVNTRIILILLFYVLILPTGLIMRLVGYDPMQRKIDPQLKTYRKLCNKQDRQHMRQPY